MTSGVYVIRHLPSGREYVGQSANIEHRWSSHRGRLRACTHPCPPLRDDSTGQLEDFVFEVLEECAVDDLQERERHHIQARRPHYNLTSGKGGKREGSGRKRLSPSGQHGRGVVAYLTPEDEAEIRQIGGGSFTAGMRTILTHWENTHEKENVE